jgi:hypothetical protein
VGEFLCCGGIIMVKTKMNEIKEDWMKKKSIVWKGGVIGAVFGLLIIFINFFSLALEFITLSEVTGLLMVPSALLVLFIFGECSGGLGCLIYLLFFYIFTPISYGLLGLLIGFIISLIKRKKK